MTMKSFLKAMLGCAVLGMCVWAGWAQDRPGQDRPRDRPAPSDRDRPPELRELAEQVHRLQRQVDVLRQELKETQEALRHERPDGRRHEVGEAENHLKRLSGAIKEVEQFIAKAPDSREAKEAREKLAAMVREREELLRRLGADKRDREAPEKRERDRDSPEKKDRAREGADKRHEESPGRDLERHKERLHAEVRELAQAFRRAEGQRREELKKKFDDVAGELVEVHQKSLRLHVDHLERELRKVREELEHGKERGSGMIDKLRRELLEK